MRTSLAYLLLSASSLFGCGASDDSGVGGFTPIAAPACGSLESRLVGELDGEAIDASFVTEGFARDEATFVSFGDLGVVLLKGEADDDGTLHGDGWVRMPDDAADEPSAWFCAGGESQLRITDNDVTGSLTGLSRSGTCPGLPIQGSLTLCMDDTTSLCAPSLTSDVPLFQFEVSPNMGYFLSGAIGSTSARLEVIVGDGILVLDLEDLDFGATDVATAPVVPSFAVTPRNVVDAGAVYCTGAGSTLEYRVLNGFIIPLRATLVGLSRLPTCETERGGELGFCMDLAGDS
ncbi:MAG: hypothetical protein U0271_34965 [Polyangiaceae bacterium]